MKKLTIAILGPDGSGKSTVIGRVVPWLAGRYPGVEVIHFRPVPFRRSASSHAPTTDPHGQTPRSPLSGMVKLAYLLAAYHLGYWTTVRPLLREGKAVVFDRYYHDLLVDSRRYRLAHAGWLARFVGRLIPKPGFWLLLDAPAEVIQQRKQEVPIEESRRQREAYLAMVSTFPRHAIVDASRPVEDVVAQVTQALERHLSTTPGSGPSF